MLLCGGTVEAATLRPVGVPLAHGRGTPPQMDNARVMRRKKLRDFCSGRMITEAQ